MSKDNRSQRVREARHSLLPAHGHNDIGIVSAIVSSDTSAVVKEEDYLINFRKHWREYKVLAKLMDLQASATRFKIREDATFKRWFETSTLISESEA